MRRALKLTFDGIKVFLLFTSCTILFYFAILWINEEYESYHRYEKPKEETVEKVSGNEEPAKDAFVNRMMFFYENGEQCRLEDQLKDFIHYMIVEKGLAKNTVVSYERDLKSYVKYLQNVEQMKTFHEVTRLHIVNFLQYLKENGKSSKTLARHIA